MLDSTIKDMENLIEDLKLKVLKAERLAESAEDKCITLSESNSDLNEELCFLRGRMDCLKVSLHQAEETKKATRKDIRIQTKLITDLVMQLALERERLQKQYPNNNACRVIPCTDIKPSDVWLSSNPEGFIGVISMLMLSLHQNLSLTYAMLSLMTGSAGVAIADVTKDACVTVNNISHPSLDGDMQSLGGLISSIG